MDSFRKLDFARGKIHRTTVNVTAALNKVRDSKMHNNSNGHIPRLLSMKNHEEKFTGFEHYENNCFKLSSLPFFHKAASAFAQSWKEIPVLKIHNVQSYFTSSQEKKKRSSL